MSLPAGNRLPLDNNRRTLFGGLSYLNPAVSVAATFDPATGAQLVTTVGSVLPTGAATAANQTNGNQKTQIVDGSGNVIGSTSNALDINVKSGTVTANIGTTNGLALESGGNLDTIKNNTSTPTTPLNGKTSVTTAGTRVTLAGSTACKSVTIKALITNTGIIYVGSSTVTSSNGFQLYAGESVSLDISNLNTINIDSSVNGEGVTYLGVV